MLFKAVKLKNLMVTCVSLVNKGANGIDISLSKSEEEEGYSVCEIPVDIIAKSDNEEMRLVYGVVYRPNKLDKHGHFVEKEEIEKAAHEYIANFRQMDSNHDMKSGVAKPVESYIAKEDFNLGKTKIFKGDWVMAAKLNEDAWKEYKDGNLNAFSLYGKANQELVEKKLTKEEFIDLAKESNIGDLTENKDGSVSILFKSEDESNEEINQGSESVKKEENVDNETSTQETEENPIEETSDNEEEEKEKTVEERVSAIEVEIGKIKEVITEELEVVIKAVQDNNKEIIEKSVNLDNKNKADIEKINKELEEISKALGSQSGGNIDDVKTNIIKAVNSFS